MAINLFQIMKEFESVNNYLDNSFLLWDAEINIFYVALDKKSLFN